MLMMEFAGGAATTNAPDQEFQFGKVSPPSSFFLIFFFFRPFSPSHQADSFFYDSKLPLTDLVALIYCLVLFRKMSHVNLRQILDIEENTISSWWIKIKDQIVSFFDSSPLKLGFSFSHLFSSLPHLLTSSPLLLTSSPHRLFSSPLLLTSSPRLSFCIFFFTRPQWPTCAKIFLSHFVTFFQEIAKLTNPCLERSESITVENVYSIFFSVSVQ